jgi:hypothetical protein
MFILLKSIKIVLLCLRFFDFLAHFDFLQFLLLYWYLLLRNLPNLRFFLYSLGCFFTLLKFYFFITKLFKRGIFFFINTFVNLCNKIIKVLNYLLKLRIVLCSSSMPLSLLKLKKNLLKNFHNLYLLYSFIVSFFSCLTDRSVILPG